MKIFNMIYEHQKNHYVYKYEAGIVRYGRGKG